MEISNIKRLQEVAEGLGDLNERVTYVGGSVTALYATDKAVVDPRPTLDVDCVVEYFSFQEKEDFEAMLRQKHFAEDIEGDVICRWIYKQIEVDIMPTDERYFSFSNRWYKPGVKNREPYMLPNGRIIYIMPLMLFIATKLEALSGRGGDDLRGSKDFEDIVYVLNACPDFAERYQHETNEELKNFIIVQFSEFTKRSNIMEEITCALPLGEEERADLILDIFKTIGT